ncbi:FAD-binding protein, partial [Pirellulaceae bacterium]|nr:FAD-binding protein [Pirellulaceae bacterium]
LDLTHIPRAELDRKLGGIMEIYEKFQGVDPRDVPMKIFPAVHYSMGGVWVDFEKSSDGGLVAGSPRNQQTNVPGLFAIGECDYQYHGANRLGANSLLSCIFSGLFTAPGVLNYLSSSKGLGEDKTTSLCNDEIAKHKERHESLLSQTGGENPYMIHRELGDVMTKAATVVRRNEQLEKAYETVCDLAERANKSSLADTGSWTNQNVVFTKSLIDMFPLAKALVKGALQRDECRGAHYKPDFAMPPLQSTDDAGRRQEAEKWCDKFQANIDKWLKTTVADLTTGEPKITYEAIDTSSIPPRPRLYGLVGAEVIDEVWKERQRKAAVGNATGEKSPQPVA